MVNNTKNWLHSISKSQNGNDLSTITITKTKKHENLKKFHDLIFLDIFSLILYFSNPNTKMRDAQLVMGPAGSGKSTYCSTIIQHAQGNKN